MKISLGFLNVLLAIPLCVLWAGAGTVSGAPASSLPRVAPFELIDQFDTRHSISFPATDVTVITVADKGGSAQINGWIAPLMQRYGKRIAILGIAELSGVPRLLRGLVRDRFKKSYPYSVMLDWDGRVTRGFDYHKGKANVFVINRDGYVTSHFTGGTNQARLSAAFVALDRALSKAAR